jgi:hypothetical protein
MTYAGHRPINHHWDPPKRERVCATQEYSTPHPYTDPAVLQDRYTLLLPSLHSQCSVVLSHNEIAKVLGLTEYVASTTKSRPHDGLQRYGPQSTQADALH